MEYERYAFPQPMYGDVNVLRIGDTLVDTGHVAPVCRDAVTDALENGPLEGVDRVLHTHPHVDHVGGSQTIAGLTALPHVVPDGHLEFLEDYAGYLRRARDEMTQLLAGQGAEDSMWDTYFPIDDYADERIDVARVLEDGDVIEIGGYPLEVISTPGHADPHVALWHADSGTLFSGDLVDPDGRFQYGPLMADVGEYKRSLRRVEDLDPDVLVPMHAPPMEDAAAMIETSLSNAAATEERILEFVGANGPCYAREFVLTELGVDGGRTGFLTLVTYEYCRHLEERGDLAVEVTDEGIWVS
jgi:glyoxylase-like metal-dependent hydrolase (beta-lactamase superfamily II)